MTSFRRKLKKCNLMIIGASGGVANAFLHHLSDYRGLFRKIVLVDKNDRLLKDVYINHKLLDYVFIQKKIELPDKEHEYLALLKAHNIDIVLDITDMNSIELLEATNKAGVSYINTAINDDKKNVEELYLDILKRKNKTNKAVHILCTGMNPGNVNMWVRYGIEKFGVPKQIIHFEYDTSKIAKKWHPMVTWSIHEFLVECVQNPSGVALGRGKIKELLPNALENRESMKKILSPIMKLDKYPYGLTVLHEENVSISYKYDVPSKFIYAINPKTMQNLINIYEKKKKVTKKDLQLGDNTREVLDGADNIGVILDYEDKTIYYFNTCPNVAVIGTNATYTQVIIGIFSALFTRLVDKLPKKIYFVEDLYHTHFKYFMFDNMRVQEYVFSKNPKRHKLVHYNPMVKLKRRDRFEHLYII
ncbi:saccharopine dehydrogenase NADP-binding domain-containing protein [Candidatus Woesearchaeota archaeon]|nr:saccharopine dehydrogenase NADP-binding domain-containing protein [Candidatus Woesearchaeota archaeon]